MPRSVNSFCSLIASPKSCRGLQSWRLRENETSCVLATLILTRQTEHHCSMSDRHRYRSRLYSFRFADVHKLRSSANCPAWHLFTALTGMSLTYMLKSSGVRTLPCGVPACSVTGAESSPSIRTLIVLKTIAVGLYIV